MVCHYIEIIIFQYLKMKKSKKYSSFVNILFVIILILWIIISLFRTVYNFSKIYTEEVVWFKLSDFEQREKIFGDKFLLLNDIKELSNEKSRILFLFNDKDVMHGFNYLANYYLYPRVINSILYKKTNNYEYKNYNIVVLVFKKDKDFTLGDFNVSYKKINFIGENFNAVIFKK